MEFTDRVLKLNDREYRVIRELSYITGIAVEELLEEMFEKWLSTECSTSIKVYIDDYKLELENYEY